MRPTSIVVRGKPGVLCPRPRHKGMFAEYVGRTIDHGAIGRGETDVDVCYPPFSETVVLRRAPGTSCFVNLDEYNAVVRYVRDGDLDAADVATAKFCGVKFARSNTKD